MGKFHNFYLGWAREAQSAPFYPIHPPNIKDDPQDKDFTEHEEPWPKNIPTGEEQQGGEGGDGDQE